MYFKKYIKIDFRDLKNVFRTIGPFPQRYRLMLKCWLENPDNRPTFGELAKNIMTLIEAKDKSYIVWWTHRSTWKGVQTTIIWIIKA